MRFAANFITIGSMKKSLILLFALVSVGISAQVSPGVYTMENTKINTSLSDPGTTYAEGDRVAFNSPNEKLTYTRDEYNGKYFLQSHAGELTEVDRLIVKKNLFEDSELGLDEAMATFSKDMKTVFFSVNRKIKNKKGKNGKEVKTKNAVHLQLFKASVNENGEWVNLEMLPFNNSRYSTGQPVLNQDDTKLYFVSDGPESLGRTDIFTVDIYEDGTYGKPVNLGPKINTEEREIFPFIDLDDMLFFSSDVNNGSGELDVFASRIFDNTVSVPIKLDVPVNSEQDDLVNNIDNKKGNESVSSNRQSGKGEGDIYAFLASFPIHIECQQNISGVVRNEDTKELLTNIEFILLDEQGVSLQSFSSNENDTSFSFKQSCNTTYTLKGYKEGYSIGELEIKTVNDLNAAPLELVMKMSKVPNPERGIIVDGSEVKNSVGQQTGKSTDEIAQVDLSNEDSVLSFPYDFSSDNKVYTVQIGAFQGIVITEQYKLLSDSFNHQYDDGLNRYFSGIFKTYLEAQNHTKLMKKKGYNDAFVVGLKGNDRF